MTRKNTFLLLLLAVLLPLNCFAGEKQVRADERVTIKGEKEMLIMQDVGGGLPVSSIEWCGNKGVLIDSDKFGTQWVGLNGDKVTVSTKDTDRHRGCTPDGKWVLYKDRKSSKTYRDKQGRLPEYVVGDGPGWHGFVTDLYRFEIATGVRQKFAVVRDDSTAVVSPDGLKVFLGNRHDSIIQMPEPKWEKVWLTNDWVHSRTRWFADSSGITTMIWSNGYDLGVEFYGKQRWSKEFSLDIVKPGLRSQVSRATMDENDILRFVTTRDYSAEDPSGNKYYFFQCKVKGKDLVCTLTHELKKEKADNTRYFKLLPNGDIIYEHAENNCIHRIKYRSNVMECIADTRYGDDVYLDIRLVEISPDGKRMLVRRGKLPPERGDRFYVYQLDLFVVDITNN